jgi:hypothetical protein
MVDQELLDVNRLNCGGSASVLSKIDAISNTLVKPQRLNIRSSCAFNVPWEPFSR